MVDLPTRSKSHSESRPSGLLSFPSGEFNSCRGLQQTHAIQRLLRIIAGACLRRFLADAS